MFSWSSSDDLLLVTRGEFAFAWFVLSLSARLSGLLGEIRRVAARKGGLRLTAYLGLGVSVEESAFCPRERSEGDVGALGDLGAFGDFGETIT